MMLTLCRCLLLLCLVFSVHSILIGRLRQSDTPDYNVVRNSGVRFPTPDDDAVECKTDHGYLGKCVDIRFCYAARMAVRANSHPVRCGWINHSIPRVCCHPDQVQRVKMVFRPYRNRRRNRNRTSETIYQDGLQQTLSSA